jgi:transposase-like protein
MTTRRPRPASVPLSAFAGFRFPPDVIVLAVRWYLRFGRSYRDVEELLTDRGIEVDHVTVYRWVVRSRRCWLRLPGRAGIPFGSRWQVDETYVRVAGRWRYVYRAIDQFGQVIDVFVSPWRDATAARRFFERAMGSTKVTPVEVVTDRAPTYPVVLEGAAAGGLASHRAVCQQPHRGRPRQAEGAAAANAGAQAGPQRQGDRRWAWVRAERSARALRAGGGRAADPAAGGGVQRAGRGDLIPSEDCRFSLPRVDRTQHRPQAFPATHHRELVPTRFSGR